MDRDIDVTSLGDCALSYHTARRTLNATVLFSWFALSNALDAGLHGVGVFAAGSSFEVCLFLRVLWLFFRRFPRFTAGLGFMFGLPLFLGQVAFLILCLAGGVLRPGGEADSGDDDAGISYGERVLLSERSLVFLFQPTEIGGVSTNDSEAFRQRIFGLPLIYAALFGCWAAYTVLIACLRLWRIKPACSQLNYNVVTWSRELHRPNLPWCLPKGRNAVGAAMIGGVMTVGFGAAGYFSWWCLQTGLLGPVPLLVAAGFWRFAFGMRNRFRRYLAVGASIVLEKDKRRFIVFLRSFTDDRRKAAPKFWSLLGRSPLSFEESLVRRASKSGPVLAIGRPNEKLPEVGAAREYVSDDLWQSRVAQWIDQCELTLLLVNSTSGLLWELSRFDTPALRRKLCLVISPGANKPNSEWKRFVVSAENSEVGSKVSPIAGNDILLVTFDADDRTVVLRSHSTLGEHYDEALRTIFRLRELQGK